MARWLVKTEPDVYSYDDLAHDGRGVWDGVRNATALGHLRRFTVGDEVFVYHSGKARAIVGVARVARGPYPDPAHDDPRLVVVDLVPVRRFAQPVTLAAIKADSAFAAFDLVRISRLSVMAVPDGIWQRIVDMS
ncbi:MAG TPA: EVE domain-containing protein [Candidatus Krumholzibacteria bacterium]|nr:EVE domain-containing protein [Candidatus Krumholzibacteria bacterium]HPD72919.1 EVE domain-containing protein [Candidatus Krumholzibacteria bacterium]HRY41718.1 EVE domain-containing protein [Candidatus Krumholzibacteria bacterium]